MGERIGGEGTEARMGEELAYHKTSDKGTISIRREKNGWIVAKFSASDIEEWSIDYGNEQEAWKAFRRASEEA